MTTSSTYNFNPAAAELFAAALGMCGIRRTEISTQHITDATFHANMVLVDFSNKNPQQWALETQQVILSPSVITYSLSTRTIAIGAAYISITLGGDINDRLISSLSASEYAAIPNKTQTGFPNSYWFNLQTPAPVIRLYYAPDSNYTYTLNLLTFRQMQDLNQSGDQTIDAPYRYLDAFTTALAARLAMVYPDPKRPQLPTQLDALAERRYQTAAARDQEEVNLYVVPGMQGYFR